MAQSETAASSPIDPSVLLALAERCEREKPSHELSLDISEAVNGVRFPSPMYTTNTDDALTLRLDWMSVSLSTGGELGLVTYVEVFVSDSIHWTDSQADTPAAALCAALLRGRADAEEWASHYFRPRASLAENPEGNTP